MDTVQSRKTIGFPGQRSDWNHAKAVFDEHSLKIAGHPVMEDWELGYMKQLAAIATRNGGRILEVGFGLGLSAGAIQDNEIDSHFVVEAHPDVIKRGLAQFRDHVGSGRMHFISGFWEDATPLLADKSFDGILFDTYPLSDKEIHSNHFWFFEEAWRLLKPGGILTYYSDEAVEFSEKHLDRLLSAGFKINNINFKVCDVDPPAGCEYWQEKTILAPVIVK